MKKLINLLIILFFTLSFSLNAQNQKVNIHFYKNCKENNDFKCYYAKKDSKAYLLKMEGNLLLIPDSINSKGIPLLLVTKKERILFPFYHFKEAKNVSVYSNNIFINSCIEKYKVSLFKRMFKKRYFIDIDAMDDLIMVYKPTRNYTLIE